MNMSDHWKSLTRLLGAPDAAEPPKKAKKAPAARPAADSPAADSPAADSPAADAPAADASSTEVPSALDPPEPLEDRSKPSSSSLLEDLTQVPDRQSLPGFEQQADAGGNASWDALVQDLGIESNEPPAPAADKHAPAADKPAPAAKAKADAPRRGRETAKPAPRANDGFGSGLIDSEDSLGDSDVVDAAVCELEAEPQDAAPASDAGPGSDAGPASDATPTADEDARSEDLAVDDDDLFSGFKGRPARRRRGESRSRDTDSRSEKPRASQSRESRSAAEDRPQARDTPGSEPVAEFGAPSGRRRSRNDRDAEPVGDDAPQQDAPRRRESSSDSSARDSGSRDSASRDSASRDSASRDSASRDSASRDSASPGRSRRGRRRGQRQRIADPVAAGFEEDDLQADPVIDNEESEQDEAGVQNSLDRVESTETEDEAPRRRRRRRRGRGGRGERSRDEAGTASEPRADRDRGGDDRDQTDRDRNDQVRSEKVGPAIDAVFDDDHEDAEEVTELRRGRRRRPRRGRGGEKGEPQTERSGEPSSRDSEPAADEGAAPSRRHREVTTWQDTVDILISSNMSGRKNDSRGRGRQRSGGNSRRRD